jgi:hypothetical protein
MREQEIRRILKEVCDSIDRQRATAGGIAMGVAIAIGAAGCETEPKPLYALPTNIAAPADASSASTSSSTVSDSAPPPDAATAPPMVVKYGAPDPETTSPPPPSDAGMIMVPKYGLRFDAGAVHKYGAPPALTSDPPAVRYGVPPDNSP